MSSGRLGAGVLAVLTLLAATGAGSAVPYPPRRAAAVAGPGRLTVFGGRSAAQLRSGVGGKLDATLADLTRHTARVRASHELEDLHALNPAARFARRVSGAPPLIAIDAVTRGDPQQLRAALERLGLQRASVYSNDVGGWLPVNRIASAAALAQVHSMRAALSRARAAAVSSQGDFAQGSAALRTTYPTLNGAGVTVGILSDSFNCYGVYDQPGSGVPASGTQGYAPNGFANDDATFDESNGFLPASVNVLEEGTCMQYGQPLQLPFADEGRALMQIVHDVAPGAKFAFYTATDNEADFANGIIALANNGATVIADDVGYFDEPFFQDGIVAQAIDTVVAQGVVYFSAAGNNGQNSYENTAPSFSTAGTGANAGEMLLNFDSSGATTTTALQVAIPELLPGDFIGLIVEWDQPYLTGAPGSPGSTSSIDFCVTGASGYTVVNLDGSPETCTGPNTTGADTNQPNNGDAEQVLILGNPANAAGNSAATTITLIIGLAHGTPAPGRIKLVVADNGAGATIDPKLATNSPTLQGHPSATGAAAVAAAFFPQTPRCGTTPAVLEPFSAAGGEPILFDWKNPTAPPTPVVRQKPDFTAPDGVNTSFFGFAIAKYGIADNSSVAGCQNNAGYLNFFGTSAATPHAAGVAALMLQANPAATPSQILDSLRKSAAAMGGNAPNYDSGYGFLQADAALALLPPGPPVIQLASSTIPAGGSTTLSWLAVNATSCSASGSWSGTQSTSGTLSVTPASPGIYTYTLTCATAAGSKSSSAVLTDGPPGTQPPSSGGGGGALEILTPLSLCGLFLARARRARQTAHARR